MHIIPHYTRRSDDDGADDDNDEAMICFFVFFFCRLAPALQHACEKPACSKQKQITLRLPSTGLAVLNRTARTCIASDSDRSYSMYFHVTSMQVRIRNTYIDCIKISCAACKSSLGLLAVAKQTVARAMISAWAGPKKDTRTPTVSGEGLHFS